VKRAVLYAMIFLGFSAGFTHFNESAAQEVHKRSLNGKKEYEILAANSTRWFVILVIDGHKRGLLKPSQEYPNAWDGSLIKLWLTLGTHRIAAFAYESQSDISNGKPVRRLEETLIDITGFVDKERQSDGSFRVPYLEFETDNFTP
jgi:hypothetical protein